jgi:HlyD family secretion protein
MKREKEEKIEDIELRSEEFQEVLGGVPAWIVRWGITVLGVIVVILLIGSAIFKYPDVISAQITITGLTPPASIVARSSGKIKELYVKDNQDVKAGDYLAVIDNPARTEDVRRLALILSKREGKSDVSQGKGNTTLPNTSLAFGESRGEVGSLQSIYSQYYTALFQYSEYKRLLYYPQKIEITRQRIAQYEQQYENLQKQYRLIEEQTGLQEKQYQRDISLNKTGVVSAEELEKSRAQYLQSELSRENMKSTINNMRIQIGQLKESLLDTRHQDTETLNQLETNLQTLETQLKVAIEEWELTYVLKAPIDGRITFTSYWTVNQNVTAGSEVFAVVHLTPGPSPQGEGRNTRTGDEDGNTRTEDLSKHTNRIDSPPEGELEGASSLFGKAQLPIARSGKVQVGQKVNIRLENFPENEFGILQGKVKNISLVPAGSGDISAPAGQNGAGMAYYTIDIELTDGLMTTYHKELPCLPNMQGRADIITEDISLLERFFLPLKKILSESL